MKTPLRQGERVIREGAANIQRGIEAVGGRLYLTNQRLVFESHAFAIQTGVTEIELVDVRGTRPCWTKLLGVPLFPNSLAVTSNEVEHKFVLAGRGAWADAIHNASNSREATRVA